MLLAHDVDYLSTARPTNNPSNHGKLSLSLFSRFAGKIPEWYDDADDFAEVAASVRREIENSACSKIIVSSEEFYRYARLDEQSSSTAISELRALFSGYEVRVIMHLRAPLDFMKSWYNQLNKAPVPRRRFTDVFYHLDDSMLIPQLTAEFWRKCFGPGCMIVRPYVQEKSGHLERFFKLIDVDLVEDDPLPQATVNEKRSESDLEFDRLRKILSLDDPEKQRKYLNSTVLQGVEAFNALEQKVARVNRHFEEFCLVEGLQFPGSEFAVSDLLVHEECVNPKDVILSEGLWPNMAPPAPEPDPPAPPGFWKSILQRVSPE